METLIIGFVTFIVGYAAAYAQIKNTSIIQERKKWRDDLREQAVRVHDEIKKCKKNNNYIPKCIDEIIKIKYFFTVRLNLTDEFDNEIIDFLDIIIEKMRYLEKNTNNSKDYLEKELNELERCERCFIESVAILMKYDWERAKREASFLKSLLLSINDIETYFAIKDELYINKKIKKLDTVKILSILLSPVIIILTIYLLYILFIYISDKYILFIRCHDIVAILLSLIVFAIMMKSLLNFFDKKINKYAEDQENKKYER